MPKRVRALFVCEGNRHRSPTAERLYATTPGVKVRSAGTSPLARVELTDEQLEWADVVFVMDRSLERSVRQQFAPALGDKTVVCLEIPDDFQFMQAALLALLTERLTPHLGAPHSAL